MAIIERAVKLGAVAAASTYQERFEPDICLAGQVNRELLQQILLQNRDTEYGQRYRFDRIATPESFPESFKEAVPLTTYEDYLPYIDRIAAGQDNILTAEPVRYFGLTSGTTGQQKMIPMTELAGNLIAEHMSLLSRGICDAVPASRRSSRGLNIMNMITAGATEGGIPTGAGSLGGLTSIRRIVDNLWTSPPEVLEVSNQWDANYLHLLFALRERDLMYIYSPFSSAVVDLFRLLEREWPQLVHDLANGRISNGESLDLKTRARLEGKLGRHPERAEELAAEFRLGFQGIARRIWPQLLYVSCVTGGSFSIYTQRLHHYIDGLPLYAGMYGATEAVVGISLWPGEATYVVTPRTAYHEFIPLNQVGENRPQAFDLDQLVKGQSYEVVVTNCAGFYRYRLGDIVKVVDHYYESPVIEFLYRRGQLISLVGEKTSEEAFSTTVYGLMQQWGTDLVDFTTRVDYEVYPCRYIFYVESGHPYQNRERQGETLLEDVLCQTSPRYHSSRQAKRLGQSALRLVQPGTFEKMKKMLIARGASANEVKIPRVIRDEELAALLTANTIHAARDALCTVQDGICQ
ncbi:MAG: GH3 auxin-responsive promoter family protein [Thermacetogeniaceae bacterium]